MQQNWIKAVQQNWNVLKQKAAFTVLPRTSCDLATRVTKKTVSPTRALVPVIPLQWVGKGTVLLLLMSLIQRKFDIITKMQQMHHVNCYVRCSLCQQKCFQPYTAYGKHASITATTFAVLTKITHSSINSVYYRWKQSETFHENHTTMNILNHSKTITTKNQLMVIKMTILILAEMIC